MRCRCRGSVSWKRPFTGSTNSPTPSFPHTSASELSGAIDATGIEMLDRVLVERMIEQSLGVGATAPASVPEAAPWRAAVEQYRGIQGRFAHRRGAVAGRTVAPGFTSGGKRDARQHGGGQIARCLSQLVDRCTATAEKARLLKEVSGRVTANGQLREDSQARAQG